MNKIYLKITEPRRHYKDFLIENNMRFGTDDGWYIYKTDFTDFTDEERVMLKLIGLSD